MNNAHKEIELSTLYWKDSSQYHVPYTEQYLRHICVKSKHMPRLLNVDHARVVQQLRTRAITRMASFRFDVAQSTEVRTYSKFETLLISFKKEK